MEARKYAEPARETTPKKTKLTRSIPAATGDGTRVDSAVVSRIDSYLDTGLASRLFASSPLRLFASRLSPLASRLFASRLFASRQHSQWNILSSPSAPAVSTHGCVGWKATSRTPRACACSTLTGTISGFWSRSAYTVCVRVWGGVSG